MDAQFWTLHYSHLPNHACIHPTAIGFENAANHGFYLQRYFDDIPFDPISDMFGHPPHPGYIDILEILGYM